MKRFFLTLCLILAFASETCARNIYVRLASGGTCNMASDSGMILTDGAGKTVPLGKSAQLVIRGGKVAFGRQTFRLPARVTGSGLLKFNNRSYRGSFLLTQRGGLLNVLDIEQYLCGVLPAEVGADWPDEALRAQAIISRTYALRQSLGRAKRGYDVVDTVADQVYRGAGVETEKTNMAVSTTDHRILAYGNELAFTPFHSDSGGYTASNAHVWGTEVPYLVGVPEPLAYSSPVSSWTARISGAKITQAVTKLTGTNIGSITAIMVSEVDRGGRAISLTFTGNKGSRTIRASQFRLAVGASLLKSTMLKPSASDAAFNPAAQAPQPAPETSSPKEQGSGASPEIQELYNIVFGRKGQAPVHGRGLPPTASIPKTPEQPRRSPSVSGGFSIARSGNDFVFYGKGWGHGVGLSQWGALALARNGWTAERILTHYYPGTSVRSYQ